METLVDPETAVGSTAITLILKLKIAFSAEIPAIITAEELLPITVMG